MTMIPARMRDDPALPRVLARRFDRDVGTTQLERASGLEGLGLEQEPRLEHGERDQRRADDYGREQSRRFLYLGQVDQTRVERAPPGPMGLPFHSVIHSAYFSALYMFALSIRSLLQRFTLEFTNRLKHPHSRAITTRSAVSATSRTVAFREWLI
jgi:hypothetical protein